MSQSSSACVFRVWTGGVSSTGLPVEDLFFAACKIENGNITVKLPFHEWWRSLLHGDPAKPVGRLYRCRKCIHFHPEAKLTPGYLFSSSDKQGAERTGNREQGTGNRGNGKTGAVDIRGTLCPSVSYKNRTKPRRERAAATIPVPCSLGPAPFNMTYAIPD